MIPDPLPDDPRLQELLIDSVLVGLSPAEEAELNELLRRYPQVDRDMFAGTVGSLDVAMDQREPMPEALRDQIAAQAHAYFSGRDRAPADGGRKGRGAVWAPWMVAAASLALAVLGWTARTQTSSNSFEVAVVDGARDKIDLAWAAGPDPAGAEATGRVVWSNDAQRGYMTFTGLPANDPKDHQYQLWIFDRNQSEATPVDGGVFDIPAGASATVPVTAKLGVVEPYLFAVTVEKPGGVVVSDRSRLALVASVP